MARGKRTSSSNFILVQSTSPWGDGILSLAETSTVLVIVFSRQMKLVTVVVSSRRTCRWSARDNDLLGNALRLRGIRPACRESIFRHMGRIDFSFRNGRRNCRDSHEIALTIRPTGNAE